MVAARRPSRAARWQLVLALVTASSGVAAALVVPTTSAAADQVGFGPHDVHSVFHVEKSENQNQVHYGVRLDADCRPQGKNPVFAYWRRLKKGQRVDEPLVGAGVRVYGASTDQKVQSTNTAAGSHVEMYVKALKRLPVDVHIVKTKTGCQATPSVVLNKEKAKLLHAFLQLGRFGLTVKYVDVVGLKEKDGQRTSERFK